MIGCKLASVLAVLAMPGVVQAQAPVALHQTVAGLQAPARVIIDHWGIAHIRAASAGPSPAAMAAMATRCWSTMLAVP